MTVPYPDSFVHGMAFDMVVCTCEHPSQAPLSSFCASFILSPKTLIR